MSQEATDQSMGSAKGERELRFVAYNGLTVAICPQGHENGERLPISDAEATVFLQHERYPDVRVGVLDWYCTCLRVCGNRKRRVAEVGEYIQKGWRCYQSGHGRIPEGEKGLRSALGTAISEENGRHQMYLFLRRGIPPEGQAGASEIDPAFRFIREDPIGLTEVQGLFVFPDRLLGPLCGLKEALLKGRLPAELKPFTLLLYAEIMATAFPRTEEEAERAIGEELGSICERMLRDTAVFETHQDTANFLKWLGFHEG